jgi:uncharacterized protein (TIGR03437 family)
MKNAGKGYVFQLAPLAAVCVALCVPAFGQTPAIATGGTVNAADYTRSFAPGGLVSIFGSNFATLPAQPQQFPLPTSLGGVSVQLVSSGEKLPLWYVSAGQINAQLPYDTPLGAVPVQVVTASGTSNTDTITVTATAPKIFTQNFSGTGPGVVTNTAYQMLTAGNPANPADTIVLWMNSLGATSGNPVAGQAAPGSTPGSSPLTISGVTATVSGVSGVVTFAGLSPGSCGLYQVNVQAPFITITGTVPVAITVGGVTSQANVTLPYQQLGFYYSLLGGKAVAGQTQNGVSGSTSDLAFQQSDEVTWGTLGYNAWTDDTGLGSQYSVVSGLAMTLFNGTTIVYDNNGIESGTEGTFYNNTGGGADTLKPGLSDLYSMSNYFPLVFSGYFVLAQSTTITQVNAYFDALGSTTLPFNPANPYVKYRMNIWSNTSGVLPDETGNFTGNIFSSDTTAGTFSYSATNVNMVSSISTNAPKPIYRLSYVLATPLTLPAGQYWFSHDASVRASPAATSTSDAISLDDFQRIISSQHVSGRNVTHFSFFGREMTFEDSFALPRAVTVRPSAVIEHQ